MAKTPDQLELSVRLTMSPAEVPIAWARDAYADGDHVYTATLPLFLAAYPGLTREAFWELTVLEHAAALFVARQIAPEAAAAVDAYRQTSEHLAAILSELTGGSDDAEGGAG